VPTNAEYSAERRDDRDAYTARTADSVPPVCRGRPDDWTVVGADDVSSVSALQLAPDDRLMTR